MKEMSLMTPSRSKDVQEFETHYRQAVDDILNQLQTVTLLAAQVQSQTVEIGNAIESLRQTVRAFSAEQQVEEQSRGIFDSRL